MKRSASTVSHSRNRSDATGGTSLSIQERRIAFPPRPSMDRAGSERLATPEYVAARQNSAADQRPVTGSGQASTSHMWTAPSSPESRPHTLIDGTPTAWTTVPLHASPRPYETSTFPTMTSIKDAITGAPPTPPDSRSNSATSSAYSSPVTRPAVVALPGTMSARGGTEPRPRARPTMRSPHLQRSESVPIGVRVKAVIKDVFKRDAVDESQFERLHEQHWAEED